MCQMLLSIKPEHVNNILSGVKRYEFRKVRCRADVNKIIIYSTAPEKRVVAEADLEDIIEADVEDVWEITQDLAGITYEFFSDYYKGKKKAVAYKLKNVIEYDEPKTLLEFGLSFAPQSFVYVNTMA